MKSAYQELKEQAWQANLEIPRYNLALFTWGNVSAFDSNRAVFAIKPSGVAYDKLSIDDMVVLDLDGNIIEGTLKPSSDTATHRVIYQENQSIGGIVHTHSTHATAWAQSMRDLAVYGTTHADHSPVAIPCTVILSEARVKKDYELETGKLIVETFVARKLDMLSTEMVLVGGHGPFTWGKSATKAVYNSVVLEEIAKMAILSTMVAKGELTVLPEHIIRTHYERKHGPKAYYGQN